MRILSRDYCVMAAGCRLVGLDFVVRFIFVINMHRMQFYVIFVSADEKSKRAKGHSVKRRRRRDGMIMNNGTCNARAKKQREVSAIGSNTSFFHSFVAERKEEMSRFNINHTKQL